MSNKKVIVSVNRQYVRQTSNDLVVEISQIVIQEIVAELDKDETKQRELAQREATLRNRYQILKGVI